MGAMVTDTLGRSHMLCLIAVEAVAADESYGCPASLHEAYAVLAEELDELWDEVKKRDRDFPRVRDEAIQIAAVALRIAYYASTTPPGPTR